MVQSFWLLQPHNQITTIYCHGVCGDHTQVNYYKDQILEPYKSIKFADAKKPTGININSLIYYICKKRFNRKNINRDRMFLSYGKDIETIKNEIDPNEAYILYGLSRGGATIINYVAQYNPENIRALILDETPADMLDVVEKLLFTNKKGKVTPSTPIQREQWLRFFFPLYPKGAKPPFKSIPAIKNKDLPIFLIYAKKPTMFHYPLASLKNYIAFKMAGFKHVYLCEVEENAQKAKGDDKKLYVQSLHSIYKKYDLPYNPEHAVLTQEELEQLQPTLKEVRKRLNDY